MFNPKYIGLGFLLALVVTIIILFSSEKTAVFIYNVF